MSGPEELYPPVQYGWGWVLVAIGIIVAILLVAWLVHTLTRPRRVPASDTGDGPHGRVVVLEVLRRYPPLLRRAARSRVTAGGG